MASRKRRNQTARNTIVYETDQVNVFSILSLIFGIAFFIPFGPILAIVFGFVALGQIRRTAERGRGLAIAGIILGFFWVIVMIVILVLIGIALNWAFTSLTLAT